MCTKVHTFYTHTHTKRAYTHTCGLAYAKGAGLLRLDKPSSVAQNGLLPVLLSLAVYPLRTLFVRF